MALIDTYSRNLQRKRNELVSLMENKAKEQKKLSDLSQKIESARRVINSNKSANIIKNKHSEITRHEKSRLDSVKKTADIEKKISQKHKEIGAEEKKYQNEKSKIEKKKNELEKANRRGVEKQMNRISSQVNSQGIGQAEMKETLIKMQEAPKTITVLFLASNPQTVSQLKLGEEARDIQNKIRLSDHRDSVKFETRWAVRPSDILQAINEINPTVVHFSGHGTITGDLVLQNPDNSEKFVSPAAISQTIAVASDSIRLVFFNTCFSSSQSQKVVENIESSIGMDNSIGDEAARVFAAQFYSAIGFGLSLEASFEQARVALLLEGIPEEDTPQLYTAEGCESSDIFLVGK